jgi:DNA-binding Lrp family transcriptional regulator
MSSKTLKVDDIDLNILEFLQENPSLSHSQIAKELNRSQPAISSRIKVLQENAHYAQIFGKNFQADDSKFFIKLDIKTTRTQNLLERLDICPFILNSFKTSGEFNIFAILATSDVKGTDNIVENLLWTTEGTQSVKMERITHISNKMVLPVNFNAVEAPNVKEYCKNCQICKQQIKHSISSKSSPIPMMEMNIKTINVTNQ